MHGTMKTHFARGFGGGLACRSEGGILANRAFVPGRAALSPYSLGSRTRYGEPCLRRKALYWRIRILLEGAFRAYAERELIK